MRTRRLCHSPIHCGPRWLLHTEFYVKKWGDDTKTWPAQLQHHCKTCQRIHTRKVKAKQRGHTIPYQQRKPRLSHEEIKRRKRKRYHAQKKNEKWLKHRRQLANELANIKRRDAGIPARNFKKPVTGRPNIINAEPLLRWLEPFIDAHARINQRLNRKLHSTNALGELAVEQIFTPNHWRIITMAQERGSLYDTSADAILSAIGYPHMFSALYGDAESDQNTPSSKDAPT